MKKGILIVGLVVGSVVMLSAHEGVANGGNKRDQFASEESSSVERIRQNAVSSDDCVYEGDQVGTGYLNNKKGVHKSLEDSGSARRGNRRS